MNAEVNDLRAAVFLDRDGTIIEDRGDLSSPSQVKFFDDTFDALRRLGDRFLLFLVTNQPGISRRILSREEVDVVNAHVVSRLASEGVNIAATYVCPHTRSEECNCIKPNPHFLLRAAEEHQVDLKRSFTIGDHPHDVELARNCGAQGIYVLTGHGQQHRKDLRENVCVASGIGEAADIILVLCHA